MGKWLVGVDLGGTSTKLAFINTSGEIIYKWQVVTDISENGVHIIPNIVKEIDAKLAELKKKRSELLGIGMGAPGPVRSESGSVYEAINLGWRNYPLKDVLEKKTLLPVVIDNDANMAALGEMWKGAGQGAKDLVCITLGTGVGGGVIANGQVVHGASGAAGEVGHITVVTDENGAPCNCGHTGCLETVASATGIVRLAKEALTKKKISLLQEKVNEGNLLSAKLVFECAAEGDKLSLEIIEQTSHYLGMALAHIGNLLNPEKIVIGGGVSKAGDLLINSVRTVFQKHAFKRVSKSTEILQATLGNNAGVIGAAWLIKNQLDK
ncbi:ROK family glucokinase [Peribacillus asahii]|uniref:Glucokinase n=1 Tax=Peribacillus asahii TaxID=228899 RepID=A0A3T0KVN5_9BACI|nr:ROK family glucokinase [Peribacillus asahii]AZV44382.1 glucokinase [Peribacillus asahii]USK84082.1 ROK family glucokinase [Peribacillus asahii]